MNTRVRLSLVLALLSVPAALAPAPPAEAQSAKRISVRRFPYVISQPGAYVLRGHVTVLDPNVDAIQITAENVTLDLGGFTIQGPTVCSGTPTACMGGGTGSGIVSTAPNTTVRNGSVRGMGAFGVLLQGTVDGVGMNMVENVTVQSNGSSGILVSGNGGTITRCRAFQNGVNGISLSQGGHSVRENQASFNGSSGISGGGQSRYEANVVRSNADFGIFVGGSNMLVGNLAQGNGDLGISESGTSGYGGNALIGNNGSSANAQISVGGVQFGTNVCGNDTTCP